MKIRPFVASIAGFAVAIACFGNSPKIGVDSDFGDPAQIVTIRHDIPILLQARLGSMHRSLAIKWVVSDGSRAIADWNAGDTGGLMALALRLGNWRVVSEASRDKDGWWSPLGYPFGCRHENLPEPSARELVDARLFDAKLLPSLELRLVPNVPTTPFKNIIVDCYYTIASQTMNGYNLTFRPRYDNDTRMAFSFVEPIDTLGELQSYGNSLRFAIAASDWSEYPSSATATVRDGEVNIWLPFVLDPGRTYLLSVDGVAPPVAGIKATVEDNTLTFDLPHFSMRASTTASGMVRVN